jgi:hypothetical protein
VLSVEIKNEAGTNGDPVEQNIAYYTQYLANNTAVKDIHPVLLVALNGVQLFTYGNLIFYWIKRIDNCRSPLRE